jgi:hypothetical protein
MKEPQKGPLHTGQWGRALEWIQRCGIDESPVVNAVAGDGASIDRLSRDLLEAARAYHTASASRERRRASKSRSHTATDETGPSLVRSKGHLPPAVVGFLITEMIEACIRAGVVPPAALGELLRVHLQTDTFAAQELKAPGAFDRAALYKLAHPDATQDEIARHAGVTRPRVSQWIASGSLDRAVERLRGQGLEDFIRKTMPRT